MLRIQGFEVTVAEKTECHSLEEEERDEDTDDDKNRRTIVVEGVPEEMENIIIAALESSKKNGGPIEFSTYDQSSETLTVCFVDQTGLSFAAVTYCEAALFPAICIRCCVTFFFYLKHVVCCKS